MTDHDQSKQPARSKGMRVSARLKRGLWVVVNYHCPLQEGRFVPDLWRVVMDGFPEGIYRSLIPGCVFMTLAALAHHAWLRPVLEGPMNDLGQIFNAIGGLMLGFYIRNRVS